MVDQKKVCCPACNQAFVLHIERTEGIQNYTHACPLCASPLDFIIEHYPPSYLNVDLRELQQVADL